MVANARLIRLLQGVRRWRDTSTSGQAISVKPDLTDGDLKRLRVLLDETIATKGGEVAARRRAKSIGLTYATLNNKGRRRFFELLAGEYGHDDDGVDRAIDAVRQASDSETRRRAESALRTALRPRREHLLRRLAGIDGGLPFMVEMREHLIAHRRSSSLLTELDEEFRRVLERWFDVSLLRLEQLTWDTPASFLEKLIEYEAVHAIESWDDLRRRLGPNRRCYAFVHPGMPDDPLIFVEVALTRGMADSVTPFLTAATTDLDGMEQPATAEDDADTAIFYSISNCHRGLAGVSLGDFLIKSVVEDLSGEVANIKNFATLSPLPGFRSWLSTQLASGDRVLEGGESEHLAPGAPGTAHSLLADLVDGPLPAANHSLLQAAKLPLLRLAARYVLNERHAARATALDPVTHFHLSNGARADRLNWLANPTDTGWERGLGIMINYRYELRSIEQNHDRYVNEKTISSSDDLRKLLDPLPAAEDS